jgi:hypothetical protein
VLNGIFRKLTVLGIFETPFFSFYLENTRRIIIETTMVRNTIYEEYALTIIMDDCVMNRIKICGITAMLFINFKFVIEKKFYRTRSVRIIDYGYFAYENILFVIHQIHKFELYPQCFVVCNGLT